MRDPVRVTDKFSPEVKNSKKEYICFPFRLTLFPHPECNFNYARLMITLEGQKSQILIRDLYPREVNIPYSIDDTLSFKGNLKFGFAELSLASDRKSNIESYYPKIISSGIDNWEAIWQFENLQEDKLHTDGLLFMLVEIEKTAKIFASISLIAKARIGHKLVPLSTRSAGFNNKIQLI